MKKGQAAIESALTMPLMVFFALGIIQLTMVQQARVMTEYAGYQAARAGVVWNGNNERMHDAAVIALLPTVGKTKDWGALRDTWDKQGRYDRGFRSVLPSSRTSVINGVSLRGQVRVDTVNPSTKYGQFGQWNLASGSTWEELDFDGPTGFPEAPGLEAQLQRFYVLTGSSPDESEYRKNTLLEIRVRYFYELTIPFANQILFLSWYAANADVALHGAIDRSTTTAQNMLGRSGDASALAGQGKGLNLTQRGLPTLLPSEMVALWSLSTGAQHIDGGDRRYFLPLSSSHAMRMQSNFHRKWIVHR